ncbi:MAG TPA: hypothetical protein VGR73_00575 [Bryobacteraceae bacterium]|nr:hypothetical protein [Bryobacteraceae bacterium]
MIKSVLRRSIMNAFIVAIILSILSAPLGAQWLNHATPGIPRTADGKPNLTAPAPHTPDGKPDLSGLWQRIESPYAENIAADLKPAEVQPWAQDLVKERVEDLSKQHMSVQCLPLGPNYTNSARMTKIVQTPNLVVMLDEGLAYRQIFTDGRPLETEPNPSWMGYSVGHWDGDTLVVESFGYNDRTWLDHGGHPHTQALRVTERYRRPDFGHLQIEMTLNDPAIYARPWTVKLKAALAADTELLEDVCNEDGGSRRQHYVGKASDEKKTEAQVAPEVLTKYAGTYEEQDVWGQGPHPRMIEITVAGGKLFAELRGREKIQLVAQSNTHFTGFFNWQIDFVPGSDGVPSYLNEVHVSGNYRYRRVK